MDYYNFLWVIKLVIIKKTEKKYWIAWKNIMKIKKSGDRKQEISTKNLKKKNT